MKIINNISRWVMKIINIITIENGGKRRNKLEDDNGIRLYRYWRNTK